MSVDSGSACARLSRPGRGDGRRGFGAHDCDSFIFILSLAGAACVAPRALLLEISPQQELLQNREQVVGEDVERQARGVVHHSPVKKTGMIQVMMLRLRCVHHLRLQLCVMIIVTPSASGSRYVGSL